MLTIDILKKIREQLKEQKLLFSSLKENVDLIGNFEDKIISIRLDREPDLISIFLHNKQGTLLDHKISHEKILFGDESLLIKKKEIKNEKSEKRISKKQSYLGKNSRRQ